MNKILICVWVFNITLQATMGEKQSFTPDHASESNFKTLPLLSQAKIIFLCSVLIKQKVMEKYINMLKQLKYKEGKSYKPISQP